MSYQAERDQFIARMTQEGLDLYAIHALLRCATTLQRLAELACSSEAADRDRIPCPGVRNTLEHPNKYPCICDGSSSTDYGVHENIPRIRLQDWRAEQRAIAAVPAGWEVQTQGDPRGYTLRVIPPSYAERNAGRDQFNKDAIGVPARDSRLRF